MDKNKLKKILEKASNLQKNNEVATAKEFINLDEKIDTIEKEVKDISVSFEKKIEDISEDLKKKVSERLDEELLYEVDEEKIAENVLSKIEIPKDGQDGKDYILTDKDKKDIAKSIKVPIVKEVIREIPNEIDESGIALEASKLAQEAIKPLIPSIDTGEQIVTKINELPTDDTDKKIDASHIKNLPEAVKYYGGSGIKEIVAGDGITVDNSNLGYPVVTNTLDLSDYTKNAIEITVANLDTAIANSTLVPEQWYLVTDYATTDYVRQASASDDVVLPVYYTAPTEEIYVQASSVNTLYYKGYSKTYEGEEIGYTANRNDFSISPEIYYYYDDGNSGTVEIAPTSETTFEITSNPYSSNPDDESSFTCSIYDENIDISYNFDSTNKGTKWDFNESGEFEILDNNFDYNVGIGVGWNTADGSYGDQEISINSDTEIELISPKTDWGDIIFDEDHNSYISIYDEDTGGQIILDWSNLGTKFTVSGEYLTLADTRAAVYAYGYYEDGDGALGDYEIFINSSSTFSIDYNLDITRGIYNYGTTNIYIQWTDDTSTNLDFNNYGTLWTASGNVITLIGETHELETDLYALEMSVIGEDNTNSVNISTASYAEIGGSLYYNEVRNMDLTGSCEIQATWEFIYQELRGLIVNRTIPTKGISIDFDFRGTKFRRYKPKTYSAWSSGTVYALGDIVSYNSYIYIKLFTDGLSGSSYDPTDTSPALWARLCNTSSYQFGYSPINIYLLDSSYNSNTFPLESDHTQYQDTDWVLTSNYTLPTTITNTKIIDIEKLYTYGHGIDITFPASAQVYDVTIKFDQSLNYNSYTSIRGDFYSNDVLIRGVLTGISFYRNTGFYSNILFAGLYGVRSNATLDNCVLYALRDSVFNGRAFGIIMGYSVESYNNSFEGDAEYLIFCRESYKNSFRKLLKVFFRGVTDGNLVNQIHESSFGWTFRGNSVTGEIYGLEQTRGQQFIFNRITYWMGIALSGANFKAGTFLGSVSYSEFNGLVQIQTNTNIGASRYNTFSTITSCIFNGTVTGNYLPHMSITDSLFNKDFTNNDEKDTSSSYADSITQIACFGNFYNNRFTGRMTISNCRFMQGFQNCFFGDGTYASPTQNSAYKQFNYNTILGQTNDINIKTGYISYNTWLGAIVKYGSSYCVFNPGDAVSISNNLFGANYRGNTLQAQITGCSFGTEFANNTITHVLTGCDFGNFITNNTTTASLTSATINSGVLNSALPSIAQGFSYPDLLLRGKSDVTGTIFQAKDLSNNQIFMFNNNGLVGLGATTPDARLNVVRPSNGIGTVSNSAGSTTVTGANTIFTDSFKVGDTITFDGLNYIIASISSNTSMTVIPAVTNAHTNVAYTHTANSILNVKGYGYVGIQTTKPDKALEINEETGKCLRLTYNDSNGSATNYADFTMSSGGDLTIAPSGGDLNISGNVNSTSYKLSALNTAPSSATDTGTLGEIRITATAIYVCTATNTWVKTDLATW